MFPQTTPSIYQAPKCFITYGSMGHIDPRQKPSKGKPWNAITGQGSIQTVDLIFPGEALEAFQGALVQGREAPSYAKVAMTLGQILHGDFFTEYIKKGNILMLSEDKIPTENAFSLREGILTMFLERETYERAGLAGKPFGAKGNRGNRPRWVVSYNLREPSMLHGKKGFDRLVYACKQVLNQRVTWLFCNVTKATPKPDPLDAHQPIKMTSEPTLLQDLEVTELPVNISPTILANGDRTALEEAALDLYEWLSLVRLESPRVLANDSIDPYLSRYAYPEAKQGSMPICKIRWQGFMAASWLRDLIIEVMTRSTPGSWVSISATGYSASLEGGSRELSLLKPSDTKNEYLMWEIQAEH